MMVWIQILSIMSPANTIPSKTPPPTTIIISISCQCKKTETNHPLSHLQIKKNTNDKDNKLLARMRQLPITLIQILFNMVCKINNITNNNHKRSIGIHNNNGIFSEDFHRVSSRLIIHMDQFTPDKTRHIIKIGLRLPIFNKICRIIIR